MQRISNNYKPKFTDEECIAIYIFGIIERQFEVKAIYQFIKEYYDGWFPHLPNYQNFNRRINFLARTFEKLFHLMIEGNENTEIANYLIDSMPILVANQNRAGYAKAAKGICDKGFCSSKKQYYYGVKLHLLGQSRYKALPSLSMAAITPASVNDITFAKDCFGNSNINNITIFADKIYSDKAWFDKLSKRNITILTPIKLKKGQEQLDSADKLYSRAISSVRQPIESLFNRVQEKTNLHSASKVRSANGLIAFVFVRLACLLFCA